MEAAGNGKASSNELTLPNAKWSANLHNWIKNIFKDPMSGQLNSVLIEESEDFWIRITDSKKVRKILVAKNKQHFNQASEMPIGGLKVMEEIGWTTELV